MTNSKNSFGQKLKQIRKAKNLTQAQLAELAGANEKHISKVRWLDVRLRLGCV